MKTLALIHTTPVTVTSMKPLISGVRVVNLLDDSLLPEVVAANGPTQAVRARMRALAHNAVLAGADALMCCCSSVGEVVDELAPDLSIPFLRIDRPMAQEAARLGERIGVAATVRSTLDPTANLFERPVERVLVAGAYDALMAGRGDEHDALVTAALRDLATRVDVIVLAQASMARLLANLPDLPVPVLSSPERGVKRALEILS